MPETSAHSSMPCLGLPPCRFWGSHLHSICSTWVAPPRVGRRGSSALAAADGSDMWDNQGLLKPVAFSRLQKAQESWNVALMILTPVRRAVRDWNMGAWRWLVKVPRQTWGWLLRSSSQGCQPGSRGQSKECLGIAVSQGQSLHNYCTFKVIWSGKNLCPGDHPPGCSGKRETGSVLRWTSHLCPFWC